MAERVGSLFVLLVLIVYAAWKHLWGQFNGNSERLIIKGLKECITSWFPDHVSVNEMDEKTKIIGTTLATSQSYTLWNFNDLRNLLNSQEECTYKLNLPSKE